MCTVSMIAEPYAERWRIPPITVAPTIVPTIAASVPREEIEALRREVEALRDLLLAAKKFDETMGEPDCETDEKIEVIRRVAELVGVDLDEVFGK